MVFQSFEVLACLFIIYLLVTSLTHIFRYGQMWASEMASIFQRKEERW
jgi:hypothetical protein